MRDKPIEGRFRSVAVTENNPRWNDCVQRNLSLYGRHGDIRSDFARDYNRILHSTAYRRLKHKTQVFFATKNDHVCTRIEHVGHVMAVSYTITNHLGLNTELATTIALGHDLGHAPFGHQGESVISGIAQNELGERFWHEKNSLWFVDNLETLEDPQRKHRNLNLTYAVRDGIICHCGEVSETSIKPRVDPIDLNGIQQASEYSPFTWEGCVVKIADKISFLGRDIEDALTLKLLRASDLKALKEIVGRAGISVAKGSSVRDVNNTILMHDFIVDLCESSNPEDGLRFSEQHLNLMNLLRRFSAEYIYMNPRLSYFKSYARLVIETIFNYLKGIYKQRDTWKKLSYETKYCPVLTSTFEDWLLKYSDIDLPARERRNYKNRVVYDISDAKSYAKAVLDFISGMTDSFAIRMFEELIGF